MSVRYIRLRQVFEKALSSSVAKLRDAEKVSSCFNGYAETLEGRTNIENCRVQLLEFWESLGRREFEQVLEERDVRSKLEELDLLIDEARGRLEETQEPSDQAILQDVDPGDLIALHLDAERRNTIRALDERLKVLRELKESHTKQLDALESELDADRAELLNIYDDVLGTTKPIDEQVVQGVQSLLVELRESMIS